MTTTNKTTPNNRCYIISSEDLNQNKKLKGLFRMMHLEEVTPYGSVLPAIEGMHYYAIGDLPEGKAPVTKKFLDTIGMTEEDYKEHCEIAALLNGSPCHLRLVDDEPTDDEDETLDEVLASLGTVIKPVEMPMQEEVDANPDAYVSIDRKLLAPFFDEDTPDEVIAMVILTVLEMNHLREMEMESQEGSDD